MTDVAANRKSVTIALFSGEIDRAIAAFVIATAAASIVNLFI